MKTPPALADHIKRHIKSIPPYIPGKPIAEVERELGIQGAIKMASNENPLGPSPAAMEKMKEHLATCHIYPESSAPALRTALASRFHVSPDQVILGNGSDELMQICAHILVGADDEAVTPAHSFSMYRIAVESFGGKVVQVPLRKDYRIDLQKMAAAVTDRTRIVFFANPNSPTGLITSKEELDAFFARLPSDRLLVVIDEAYREFVRDKGCPEGVAYLNQSIPVLVLRTFSKIYGLAGMRIGYGLSHAWLIELLNRVRAPFNTNTLAQAAAAAALTDFAHEEKTRELVWVGIDYLTSALTALGFYVLPSQANFVCFRAQGRAAALYHYLLRRGVIVRHLASFGMDDWIRVTVGTMEQNALFVRNVREFVAQMDAL
ncbi:MAG: histidinol-phosphate transaminase [Desulfomonilaceae bacterium]